MDGSYSTKIIRGNSRRGQEDETEAARSENEVSLENCPKCNTLLDVSGCKPLTETSCPSCGALIKVLREFHHFVLLSELGQGGAGTVYRAFDETLERDVALKLLRNEHTSDPKYLDGIEQEALIMASISHSHVVKVYSTGRKNGYFYIAMEIVPGGSLADRIARPSRPSEAEVLDYGVQLAEGLQAAYERGLLHRDVKPGNILFADHHTIKVADFGLALRIDQTTDDADDIWGTPDYIAPEKLLRQGEDVRSDIYSVGCTLFHCLTGVPPLDTTTVWKVVESQRAEAAPDIQNLKPEVTGASAFIIKRCLEKSPADRYQSYGELIEHLQYARDQICRLGEAEPVAERFEAGSSARQRKSILPAVAALLVILGGLGAFFAFHRGPAKDASSTVVATAPAKEETRPTVAPTIRPKTPALDGFQPLDMRDACTLDTRQPMYSGQTTKNMLTFERYGDFKVNGVLFRLVDPGHVRSGMNVILLEGHKLNFPHQVEIPVAALQIRKLHILGGVAAWGWDPRYHEHANVPVARLKVYHRGGATEEFVFRNGVEFANHTRRIDVPGSDFVEGIARDEHQVRSFSVLLEKSGPVEKIAIESMSAEIAPIFVAITAETGNL